MTKTVQFILIVGVLLACTEFYANLKAGKQIGLTIPPNMLVRADRVIK